MKRFHRPACALLAALLPLTAMAATPAPADESAGDLEEVVVTGSRVTTGASSPTPLTVVSMDALQEIKPSTLADALHAIPVFAGNRSVLNTPTSTGGSGAGNGAANQANLRNLGALRNLVLMDGYRLPPTSIINIVDIDMVPQMLLDRVETVTGGASAVYGSDAISGVVNFITDKTFTGLKTQTHYGESRFGDSSQIEVGIAFGTPVGNGGHFIASYEYRDDEGVLYRSERPWYRRTAGAGNGTAALPYALYHDGTMSNLPFGGRITCPGTCSLNGQYFASNGVLSPFVSGTAIVIPGVNAAGAPVSTTVANVQIGGAGGYYDTSLKAPLKSHQFYTRFDKELSDNLKFFVMGSGNFKNNKQYDFDLTLTGMTLRSTNAFLTAAQSAALAAAGTTFTFNRIVKQGDTRINGDVDSRQLMFRTGLNGTLAGAYNWDLVYTYGAARLDNTLRNNVNEQRLRSALDAVSSGGQIVCGVNADASTTNNDSTCVPFNAFGPTSATGAMLGYVLADTSYTADTLLHDLSFNVTGSPFNTWAGAANLALAAEWRSQRFKARSGAESNALANCDGLLNCAQGQAPLWRYSFASTTQPLEDSVWEVATEAELPLVKDSPLMQSLTANAAVRYANYDSAGGATTWKAGLSWEINNDLRMRGTISRDHRAPTLNDLYAPVSIVTSAQVDRLVGNGTTSFVTRQDTLGNVNLKPEIGETWTAGIVWKPGFLSGFTATFDYYDIRISDAIQLFTGFNGLIQDTCYASGGTSPYCALQERPNGFTDRSVSNAVTRYFVKPFNIGEVKTSGFDVELNYATRLAARPLNLRLMWAHQPHIYYITPGLATTDQGNRPFGNVGATAAPEDRVTAMASYQWNDNFRASVQHRWRSTMVNSANTFQEYYVNEADRFLPSAGQTALNLSYRFAGKFGEPEVVLNVQNLFDRDPPYAASGGAGSIGRFTSYSQVDDPIGRFVTLGLRANLQR
jgi:iron complex outermembrane receptor protein